MTRENCDLHKGMDLSKPSSRNGLTIDHTGLSFEQPGGIAAKMRLGRYGPYGEDAIFVDLQKGVFAVADGTGRASGASLRFIARFACAASSLRDLNWAKTLEIGETPAVLARFKAETESILADTAYGETSTFTALLLLRTDRGTMGLLCHSGDSLAFQFVPGSGLRQLTQTNFWMVGRSKKLYQVESIPAPAGSVFLLATDGISDLRFPCSCGMSDCLARSIREVPVEAVPSDLLARYDLSTEPVDDVALVAVRPDGFRPSEEQIFVNVHGVDCRTF